MSRWLLLLIGVYVLAAVTVSAINPIFEAPDENHHYFTIDYIAESKNLPVASSIIQARQEAAQGPLYYVIASILVSPIDRLAGETVQRLNPLARLGDIETVVNHNVFIHTSDEYWPWRGFTLAVHLVRLFSVILGIGTVLCIYASGRLLWPDQQMPAILGAMLVVLLPQWSFLHGSVTNDSLIIFLCSLSLFLVVRMWQGEVTTKRLVGLGIVVGLAMLTKATGMLLLAYTIFVIGMLSVRDVDVKRLPLRIALVAAPAVAISFWWYWRNWNLYGDFTAASVFVELGGGERGLPASYILSHLEPLWLSTIAVFGWMNVGAPSWVYHIWIGILVISFLGLIVVYPFARVKTNGTGLLSPYAVLVNRFAGPNRGLIILLFVWPALVFAAWFQFNLRTSAEQGRLLFPGMLPVALMLGYGLAQWRTSLVPLVTLSCAAITVVYSVGYVIPAAYTMPSVIDESQIPRDALPIGRDMGSGIELVASRIDAMSAHPGESVGVTLYWRKETTTTTPVLVSPEILGRDNIRIANLQDAYHGGGMYPSDLWKPGPIVQEVIHLRIDELAVSPALGRVFVRLDGQDAYQQAGSVKVIPNRWPRQEDDPFAIFDGGIELASVTIDETRVRPGEPVTLKLVWQVTESVGRDLTTFVHLGWRDQAPVAQADSPPLNGDYQSSLWDTGEIFEDTYTLLIPESLAGGEYPVRIGLYDPTTGERIPVRLNGVYEPDAALEVSTVTVID